MTKRRTYAHNVSLIIEEIFELVCNMFIVKGKKVEISVADT